jgi:(p)ppGpp synthase/HD superfamily hydrolase
VSLAKAIRIAALKHGQAMDKGGQPFLGHPLRVAAAVAAQYDAPEWVLAAAALHDVLEDTGTDPMELAAEGISPEAIRLVMILTRRDEEEGYFAYIRRVGVGRTFEETRFSMEPSDMAIWATRIKLCDLADNLNPQRRVPGLQLPDRYEQAVVMLRK